MTTKAKKSGIPRGLIQEGLKTRGSSEPHGRIGCDAIDSIMAHVKENRSDVMVVAKQGHKVSNCPKAEWNRRKDVQGSNTMTPQPASFQG